MRRLTAADLIVACPLCHAQPEALCVSTGGHGRITGLVHRERRQALIDGTLNALRAKLSGDVCHER